jgi:hypothetical protein
MGVTNRVRATITVPGFPNLTVTEAYDASTPFESSQSILDAWNAIPSITRLSSTEPKEGYYWDEEWGLYFENDELFRARVKCVAVAYPHSAPTDEPKPNHVRDAVRANQ